jgi:hypothetical protein
VEVIALPDDVVQVRPAGGQKRRLRRAERDEPGRRHRLGDRVGAVQFDVGRARRVPAEVVRVSVRRSVGAAIARSERVHRVGSVGIGRSV